MPSPAAIAANRTKTGTCPHGLPLGACPICNGMAGGNSTSKRDIPRNVGEMTYNQCAAIGAMLKAQKHAREQAKFAQQNHLQALVQFQKQIATTHQKIAELAALITQNTPPIIAKPINFIINNIVLKVLNFIQNTPTNFINFIQNISQKFIEISDKLTAIFGEIKAAISEKVSKVLTNLKKKLKQIFFIFGTFETDDEDKKIEEAKRTFELKTILHRLGKKFNDRKDLKNEH